MAYDLNDPRNPSCPCHKIQKLAEDQYSNQGKKLKTSHNIMRDDKYQKTELNRGKRKFLKKRLKKIQIMKFNNSKRKLQRKKVRPDYSVCYKW